MKSFWFQSETSTLYNAGRYTFEKRDQSHTKTMNGFQTPIYQQYSLHTSFLLLFTPYSISLTIRSLFSQYILLLSLCAPYIITITIPYIDHYYHYLIHTSLFTPYIIIITISGGIQPYIFVVFCPPKKVVCGLHPLYKTSLQALQFSA